MENCLTYCDAAPRVNRATVSPLWANDDMTRSERGVWWTQWALCHTETKRARCGAVVVHVLHGPQHALPPNVIDVHRIRRLGLQS